VKSKHRNLSFIVPLLIASLIGCSTAGKQKVTVVPTPRQAAPTPQEIAPPQPPEEDIFDEEDVPVMAAVDKNAAYLKYESKKYNLDLQSGDVKDVLLALIRDTEIGLVIDPGIAGRIPVMDLKDATLKQILDYILPPLNLKFRWEGKNLHIYKNPLVTRYFKLDYLSSSRQGSRQVSFSTRSGSSGSGRGGSGSGSSGSTGSSGSSGSSGGSGGGQNQSASDISVDYSNSIWPTFIESVKVLVFGSLQGVRATQSSSSESSSSSSSSGKNIVKAFTYADDQGRELIISPETGIIVVTGFDKEIRKVAQFIESYEGSAQRQVWIEAKIMEVNLNKSYQMGVDWGLVANRGNWYGTLDAKRTLSSPAMSFTAGDVESQALSSGAGAFQFAVSNNVLDIMIDAIARQGNLKVLASPRISTLNNEKAVIRVVREEAYFNLQTQISQGTGGNVSAPTINVQVVPIGIVMDIIPQVAENGDIMLSVNPDISELLETRSFEVEGAMATQPVIDRRSIDTVARLKNGETLVIAGIIKERKSEVVKGVPLLYKIPLLGNMFRRTEQQIDRTELIILITPRIHYGQTASQLTEQERQRIKDAVVPLRLGDSAEIKEGIQGEIDPFKKKKGQQNDK